MKIKSGVKIEGLATEIIIILPVVNNVIWSMGREFVITSGLEGIHSRRSLHTSGRAIDIRLPHEDRSNNEWVVSVLQVILGKDYDVVLEKDHIHIEYDPE